MRTQTTKSTIETWCMKHGLTLNWPERTVNNIPFVLADGDLYVKTADEPVPAFTEQRFVEIITSIKQPA